MCPSPTSPQQALVMTSDEPHVHSVKSPMYTVSSEHAMQPHSNYLSSPTLSPASPASPASPIVPMSQRTPNVYINGLPPHYSEQELFALARPFGDIKSVRTFTRHVSEKPTGYGFVLFADVESAQRCIEGLRKYRNIHPSFSKQVHRIPGTEYAQHNAVQSEDMDDNSFKSRMEKLKDTASTNLYIEGLPLSIDAESLAALMEPYKIKSSRFFKTKLSNPPRIIAFVRLETRAAAEDSIERLHGRLVRGWNDPGCRISVRFADSAEQRELRRTERTLKNGDQSPSRLTIAQAALLNLRGQELQANIHDLVGSRPQRLTSSRSDSVVALNPGSESVLLPPSRSLPSKLRYSHTESPLPAISDLPSASEMDNLLESIQNMGYDDEVLDGTIRSLALDNEYLMSQQAQMRALANVTLLSPNPHLNGLPRGHTHARNGFTPAEEMILEAHAQHLRLQAQLPQPTPVYDPAASFGRIKSKVRSLDPAPRALPLTSGIGGKAVFPQDALSTISEADFHAAGPAPRNFVQPSHHFQTLVGSCSPSAPPTTNTVFVRPPNRAVSIVPPPPDYEEPGKRQKAHHQPSQPSTPEQIPCHSSTFSNHQSIPSAERILRPSFVHAPMRPNNNSNSSNDNLHSTKNPELKHAYKYSPGDEKSCAHADKGSFSSSASQIHTKRSPRLCEQNATGKDGPKSPAVISPALTYSSRSPSTMSPATPFFGAFAGNQDTFEVMTIENEDVSERKLKARVAVK